LDAFFSVILSEAKDLARRSAPATHHSPSAHRPNFSARYHSRYTIRSRSAPATGRAREELAMLYMLLLYGSESGEEKPSAKERRKLFQAYEDFTQWIKERGKYRDGNALEPSSAATVVRVRDGKTLTSAGAFAQTAEQLGGYYLIDADNLDEAIEIAARVPRATSGRVEVRPIQV
jgi:hypothetical protein